jgi:hypothetical protein
MGKIRLFGGEGSRETEHPMAAIVRLSEIRRRAKPIFFSRGELNLLLSLYSRQVMRGQWRDYAIGLQDGKALFAVFRNSDEAALYTIAKSGPQGDRGVAEFTLLAGRLPLARSALLSDIIAGLAHRLRGHAKLVDEGGR